MPNPVLPAGYSCVKPGQIANVVTCLEMTAPALAPAHPGDADFVLEEWQGASLADYREIFRAIGTDWLWYSRLVMADETLAAILDDPRVDLYRLKDRTGRVLGLLELDFRAEGECELAFFGLVQTAIGKGAGRFLMGQATRLAWARDVDGQHIRRFWVHTCTFDHPAALAFYRKAGFRPYAFMVEVADDPRLTGLLPRDAAPHVPLIDSK